MSVPSHCTLMKPASERLAGKLKDLALEKPKIPVIHNESVAPAENVTQLHDALVRQLYRPVRWSETIIRLVESGVTHIVECGPGKVLAGLNRRIGGNAQTIALTDASSLNDAVSLLKGER